MRTRVAHAPRFAKTSCTRRTALSVNPQFTTYKPKNSVQTTGATAYLSQSQQFCIYCSWQVGLFQNLPREFRYGFFLCGSEFSIKFNFDFTELHSRYQSDNPGDRFA